jgi:hypothetical protein
MYAISIQRRVPFALAENSDVRTAIVLHLDVNLSTFTIIFRLSPNFMGAPKMFKSVKASTAFNRFWDLLISELSGGV